MSTTRTTVLIGGIILAISGLLAGAFVITDLLTEPNTGANIGGGMLLMAATLLAIAGVVILMVSAVLKLVKRDKSASEA